MFSRIKLGNLGLESRVNPSRPVDIDDEQIETPIKNNPRCTTRDIAEIIYITNMNILSFYFEKKLDEWIDMTSVCLDLKESNLINRILICDFLFIRKNKRITNFSNKKKPSDETLIVYNNVEQKDHDENERIPR